MKMKLLLSYALYIVAVLSVFALNIFKFEHPNLLKLSINTLFALPIIFFFSSPTDKSWRGFIIGSAVFVISYLLFWYLVDKSYFQDKNHIFTALIAGIFFRPPNNLQSILKFVGAMFGLNGAYYLVDTIWHRIF